MTGEDWSAATAGCLITGALIVAQIACWVFGIWLIVQVVKWAW